MTSEPEPLPAVIPSKLTRAALVTGAMGGIGTSICIELLKAGHRVVAAFHPQYDNKDAWLKEMEVAGFHDIVCVAGDVSDFSSCTNMVAEAEASVGPIDILVNNAGITRDRMFVTLLSLSLIHPSPPSFPFLVK